MGGYDAQTQQRHSSHLCREISTYKGGLYQRRLDTITCTRFFAELAQLIDKDFLCKLLAGVARSLETKAKVR